MGKSAKTSRKGKKAWRANIKTDDVEDYFEKATKDALSGASSAIASESSETLFYVDKSTDIPVKRKIEKARERILHHESLLQKNAFVKPVPSSTLKKCKQRKQDAPKSNTESQSPKDKDMSADVVGMWNETAEGKRKGKKKPTIIPAVEVEPSGCSYNPSFEAHQDSLAQAVADEMQKVYQKELAPQPVPLIVTGEVIDDEAKIFVDADDGNENDSDEDSANLGDEFLTNRKPKERVTRVVQNRRARLKERLKAEAEAKKVKSLSKEIDSVRDIMEEIAKEDEEKQRRQLRRVVAKQDRLKVAPPRLGKHKFKPAPLQVLLTEEISGSLRKLKGCPTLARDRYKSFEKRGLLVPKAK